MDLHTLHALEFPKVADLIGARTVSELGAAVVPHLLTPRSSSPEIRTALRETTEFVNVINMMGRFPIGGLKDVRPALERASSQGVVLEPRQLLDVAFMLKAVVEVKSYLGQEADLFPLLAIRVRRLNPLEPLRKNISRCIGEDCSILDSASSRLAFLRRAIDGQRSHIKRVLESILSRRKETV